MLRFRAARTAGYGTAPEMARRCMERLDAERITGSLRALRVLSDTAHVSTQGPVWRVGGPIGLSTDESEVSWKVIEAGAPVDDDGRREGGNGQPGGR